ncbi:unnamed protein product [Paramecium octaurelia]|uniref:Uncharacterized protein n=1 Tax=Paramecium octaurelia TaxID=43137 RepID=A0A8S1S456_PAROT|nr:unnamed protein product [Paramecium octaurelia]
MELSQSFKNEKIKQFSSILTNYQAAKLQLITIRKFLQLLDVKMQNHLTLAQLFYKYLITDYFFSLSEFTKKNT